MYMGLYVFTYFASKYCMNINSESKTGSLHSFTPFKNTLLIAQFLAPRC